MIMDNNIKKEKSLLYFPTICQIFIFKSKLDLNILIKFIIY